MSRRCRRRIWTRGWRGMWMEATGIRSRSRGGVHEHVQVHEHVNVYVHVDVLVLVLVDVLGL